jgi:hypothetical protein
MTTPKGEGYKYFSTSEVSEFFCTAQRDMALLFGVSQSQIAMHQTGDRELPKPARAMLRNLIDAMNVAAKIEIGPEVLSESGSTKDNDHLIWMAEERLADLKKKLAAMEEKYNQAVITLYKLPQLDIKVPAELEKNFAVWMKLVKINCDSQKLRHNRQKQRPLRHRIALLEVKIKNMKEHL